MSFILLTTWSLVLKKMQSVLSFWWWLSCLSMDRWRLVLCRHFHNRVLTIVLLLSYRASISSWKCWGCREAVRDEGCNAAKELGMATFERVDWGVKCTCANPPNSPRVPKLSAGQQACTAPSLHPQLSHKLLPTINWTQPMPPDVGERGAGCI